MLLSHYINLVKLENFLLFKILGMTYNLERGSTIQLFAFSGGFLALGGWPTKNQIRLRLTGICSFNSSA